MLSTHYRKVIDNEDMKKLTITRKILADVSYNRLGSIVLISAMNTIPL
jgi:hypothetical protein